MHSILHLILSLSFIANSGEVPQEVMARIKTYHRNTLQGMEITDATLYRVNDSISFAVVDYTDNEVCSYQMAYGLRDLRVTDHLLITESCDHPQDEEWMSYVENEILDDHTIRVDEVEKSIFTDQKKVKTVVYRLNGLGEFVEEE